MNFMLSKSEDLSEFGANPVEHQQLQQYVPRVASLGKQVLPCTGVGFQGLLRVWYSLSVPLFLCGSSSFGAIHVSQYEYE
jgi:hypothetical protein